MKKLIKYISITSIALAVISCNDAEYGIGGKEGNKLGVHGFLVESMASPGIANSTVTLSGGSVTNLTLTPSLTDKSQEKVSYRLVIDEDLLKRYNEKEGTSYAILPKDLISLSKDVTIDAGKFSANPFIISISPLPLELLGTPFALPLRMEKVSGNAETTSKTSSYVYVISSEVIDDLPLFTSATGLRTDTKFSLKQFTIEMKFQIANTYRRNRDIFYTNNSKGTFMARFEDPQHDQDGIKAHSLVQFQGTGGYLNPQLAINTNKWQHYAITYDGNAISIYVNGSFAGSKEFESSVVLDGEYDYMSFMGVGGNNGYWEPGDRWWGSSKVLVTEIRVWSVCRTEDQIKNNIKSVAHTSAGLEGYWKVSKSTYDNVNKTFKDLTGHGRDLSTAKSFTWKERISSEDTETPW